MRYFIGHKSALEFWRLRPFDKRKVCPALPSNGDSLGSLQSKKLLTRQKAFCLPIDLVVSAPEERRFSSITKSHVWSNLPEGSFIALGTDLFVSTPEACFLQLARDESLIELIKIGFEITGTYAPSRNSKYGLVELPQRTTVQEIESYLRNCESCKGIAKAKRALSHIIECSASPMESAISMLLCLPSSLGGFGLPKPTLNLPITANGGKSPITSDSEPGTQREFRLDLCWPEHNFALEYDSDLFHLTPSKHHADSERRVMLEKEGIRVLSVTSKQVYNNDSFNTLVDVVCNYLEIYPQISRLDFEQRKLALRNALFQSERN